MCLSRLIYTVRPCLFHTCHAMLRPCRSSQGHSTSRPSRDGRAVPWPREEGMVGVWHGHGMASVNQTLPHYVNQTGKTFLTLSGTTWQGNGMGTACYVCESALTLYYSPLVAGDGAISKLFVTPETPVFLYPLFSLLCCFSYILLTRGNCYFLRHFTAPTMQRTRCK